jgi:uncharacterized protein
MPVVPAEEKERQLAQWMRDHGPIAIGFSGGVDSAYLAAVAVETLGPGGAIALIGHSASLAGSEEDNALAVAQALGIPVMQVETTELDDPRYAANPTNRCYFCKTVLWDTLVPLATERGFRTTIDGTNADDLHDYRPGGKAAAEHGVRSPLAEVGLTKGEIRERTRARGLPWWDRPASPCLASRLPYGTSVTPERLRQVDRAETALRALGITGNLRVRHHGDRARVELDAAELARWSGGEEFARVVAVVKGAGYAEVEIDPRGFRSGSLNVLAGAAVSGA